VPAAPRSGAAFGFAAAVRWTDITHVQRVTLAPGGTVRRHWEESLASDQRLDQLPAPARSTHHGAPPALCQLPELAQLCLTAASAHEGWAAMVVEVMHHHRAWPDFGLSRTTLRVSVSARLAGGSLPPWTTTSARASVPEAIDEALSRRLVPRGEAGTRATRQALPGRHRLAMSAFATSVLLHEAVGHAAERSRRQQAIPGCPPVTATGGTLDWDDLGFPTREQRLTASQAPALLDLRGFWVCTPHDARPRARFTTLDFQGDLPELALTRFTGLAVHRITRAELAAHAAVLRAGDATRYEDGIPVEQVSDLQVTAGPDDIARLQFHGSRQLSTGMCSVGDSHLPVAIRAPMCTLEAPCGTLPFGYADSQGPGHAVQEGNRVLALHYRALQAGDPVQAVEHAVSEHGALRRGIGELSLRQVAFLEARAPQVRVLEVRLPHRAA
jgi:hypothetical protein